MGDLILVRHGATVDNKETPGAEKFRGWRDIPLHPQGIEEAHRLASILAKEPITAILSSDLQRARFTAQAIGRERATPIQDVPIRELRPWNLGDLSGQTVDDKKLAYMKSMERDAPDQKVPGGESFHDFVGRYIPALEQLVAASQNSPGHIVAVTHTRNIRAAKGWIDAGAQGTNVSLGPLLSDKEVAPGGIIRIKVKDGKPMIEEDDASPGLSSLNKQAIRSQG